MMYMTSRGDEGLEFRRRQLRYSTGALCASDDSNVALLKSGAHTSCSLWNPSLWRPAKRRIWSVVRANDASTAWGFVLALARPLPSGFSRTDTTDLRISRCRVL